LLEKTSASLIKALTINLRKDAFGASLGRTISCNSPCPMEVRSFQEEFKGKIWPKNEEK